MAKPITISPELKNESSKRFNEKIASIKDKKLPYERKRLFSLVEQVLSKKKLAR